MRKQVLENVLKNIREETENQIKKSGDIHQANNAILVGIYKLIILFITYYVEKQRSNIMEQ